MLEIAFEKEGCEIKHDTKHFFRRSRKVKDIPREVELLNVGETVGVRLRDLRAKYGKTDPQGGHHRTPVCHKWGYRRCNDN